jgi:integrase
MLKDSEQFKSAFWDVKNLAAYLNVPSSWVYQRTRNKSTDKIPHYKLGKYPRFNPNDERFRNWLECHQAKEYDSTPSEKDEPYKEETSMARTSYQKGSLDLKKYKEGYVWVLRYRLKQGNKWIEKKERLKVCNSEIEARSRKIKREAEALQQKRMLEINQINSSEKVEMTLKEFVNTHWLCYISDKDKPSSVEIHQSRLNTHILPVLGDKFLSAIAPVDIAEMMTKAKQSGLMQRSLMNVYTTLRAVFGIAIEYDLIAVNPVRRKIHKPIIAKSEKVVVLTSEEIRKVFESVSEDHKPFLVCTTLTALRIGELLALRWQDVDFVSRTIEVNHNLSRTGLSSPKTQGSKRRIHITEYLFRMLELHYHKSAYNKPGDFVFCREDGSLYSQAHMRECVLYPALEKVGIQRIKGRHGIHLFRRSAATILKKGVGLEAAKELLGHSSVQTTDDYYIDKSGETAKAATEFLEREVFGDCGLFVAESSNVVQ